MTSEGEEGARRRLPQPKRTRRENEVEEENRKAFSEVVAYAKRVQKERRADRAGTSATTGVKAAPPREVKRPGAVCRMTVTERHPSDNTGILRYQDVGSPIAGHDLPHASTQPETDLSPVGIPPDDGLAYPYWRHYAREQPDHDPNCYFRVVGALSETESVQPGHVNSMPRLHDGLKLTIEEADGKLRRNLDAAAAVPAVPEVLQPDLINSTIHNYWYPDLTAAPFRRPPIDSLKHAASERWLNVQRGALQRMEELVRLAILNHSSALRAQDQMSMGDGKECMGLTSSDVFIHAMDQNTYVLVELLHQLTYAHRRAYVRHAPADVQKNVLRQPVLGQRELFTP